MDYQAPKNEMFDFVSCHQVLEHLQDPTGLLVSIRNCLNDEGLFFCLLDIMHFRIQAL